MSSTEASPPAAMTGMATASAMAPKASTLKPITVPSRSMSVMMRAPTPASSNRFATVTASRSVLSVQPWVATLPARTSTLTAICSGQSRDASITISGWVTATVPRMTLDTPASIQRSTSWRLRTPPPSWTGVETAPRMASTASPLTARPSTAPLRSTTWIQWKPAPAQVLAWLAGEVLKTVAVPRSPCRTRTHSPSFRSMAG